MMIFKCAWPLLIFLSIAQDVIAIPLPRAYIADECLRQLHRERHQSRTPGVGLEMLPLRVVDDDRRRRGLGGVRLAIHHRHVARRRDLVYEAHDGEREVVQAKSTNVEILVRFQTGGRKLHVAAVVEESVVEPVTMTLDIAAAVEHVQHGATVCWAGSRR